MALGDTRELYGTTRVSAAEAMENEPLLAAKRTTEIPSNLQAQYAYSADSTLLYAGFAPRGLATSAAGWLLQKFTYTVNKQLATRTIAYSSWDLRADGGTTYA
jgi:hypothetical protein